MSSLVRRYARALLPERLGECTSERPVEGYREIVVIQRQLKPRLNRARAIVRAHPRRIFGIFLFLFLRKELLALFLGLVRIRGGRLHFGEEEATQMTLSSCRTCEQ